MGYHLNVSVVSRGKGQSVTAKAAYNARDKFREERTGELKDYTRKDDRPMWSGIFADKTAPAWVQDRERLWNEADRAEKRKDAQLGLNFIASLPHQLTDQQREYIVKDFAREQFARKGLVADAHIHPPSAEGDQRNYHVHILVSSRTIGPDGFGEKFLKWEDYGQQLDQWRDKWAERGAKELEKAGFHLEAERWRVGHLDLERQRQAARERGDLAHLETLKREATTHRGPAVDAMEKKGQQTERGNIHRDTQQRNEQPTQDAAALKREIAKLELAIAQYERGWNDAQPNAAIEKQRAERKPAPRQAANDRQQGKEQARARFGDVLITRAAETAMSDTRHGEPLTSAAAFGDALEKNRLALACVTPDEAAKSHRENKFAKEAGRYAPVYQAGEIVIMREPRNDGNTGGRVHKLDPMKAEDYLRCLALDKKQLQGIEATKGTLDDRAQTRQRAIDAADLRKARSRGRSPERGGLVAHQMWALQRVRDADQQRRELDRREYSEKQKRDSAEPDSERYRTDPEYRRQVQNTKAYKSPEEKKRDRENNVRAQIEQQDRGR